MTVTGIGDTLRASVERMGGAAGRIGDPLTSNPYGAQDTPTERALARLWVSAYLAAKPPLGVSYDDDEGDDMAAAVSRAQDREQLHHYWTRGEGLAKWSDSPTPWTSLHDHLVKYLPPDEAKRAAAEWFHEVMGFWPGSDVNRVVHGHPPRGHRVGPG